jgi:hypothetical protein
MCSFDPAQECTSGLKLGVETGGVACKSNCGTPVAALEGGSCGKMIVPRISSEQPSRAEIALGIDQVAKLEFGEGTIRIEWDARTASETSSGDPNRASRRHHVVSECELKCQAICRDRGPRIEEPSAFICVDRAFMIASSECIIAARY